MKLRVVVGFALCGLSLLAQPLSDVRSLIDAGEYDQAETVARAAVEAARADVPVDDARLAATLAAFAEALLANGRIAGDPAGQAAKEARALSASARGAAHPETARCAALVAAALLAQGLLTEVGPWLDAALPILRAAGPEHAADLRDALATQALVRRELALNDAALAAARAPIDEAVESSRAAQPAEPARLARLLDIQADLMQLRGDWDGAATAIAEALDVRAAAWPNGHPGSVATYLLRAKHGWRYGQMTASGDDHRRSVELAEAALRPGHPVRTLVEARLAAWEATEGELELALPRHVAALAAAKENLGEGHPGLADYLNVYGNARVISGEYGAAQDLFQEAVSLLESVYGPDSWAVATPLYNLSGACYEAGDWQTALQHLSRARDIWTRAFGEDDARVLLADGDWGDILVATSQFAEAAARYERALRIRIANDEGDGQAAATLKGKLAGALERLGRYPEADRYVAQAAQAMKDRRGWRTREYADVLAVRARLASRAGRERDALRWARESDEVRGRHVRSTVRFLPERQALAYVGEIFAGRDLVLSRLAAGQGDAAAAHVGFELTAGRRNLVLDELVRRAQAGNAVPGAVQARLAACREQVAMLLNRGSADDDPVLIAAERACRTTESEAAPARARYAAAPASEGDLLPRLRRRLRRDTALVSFVAYRAAGDESVAYLAFVVRRDQRAPKAVPLGDKVDERVRAWREAVRGDLTDRVTHELSASIWMPLARHLGGARRVLLVPDGSLHLVNFAALVDARGDFLLDAGPTFHVLGSERDLLVGRPPVVEPKLLIAAAPEFDDRRALARTAPSPSPRPRLLAQASSPHAPPVWRGAAARCTHLGDETFVSLPASAREAREIDQVWRTASGAEATLLEGPAASEHALKSELGRHSLVHLASHGFALDHACAQREDATTLSPLLFSGMAFAGANRRREAGRDEDDGILTAQEIGGLDLSGVSWVVLSGCETAIGEVRRAEGVLGLRRAFTIAGAGTVVMSLWRVEDDDARRAMTALYRARFKAGLDTPEALRVAALAVRDHLRNAGRGDDVGGWAAFVASGTLDGPGPY